MALIGSFLILHQGYSQWTDKHFIAAVQPSQTEPAAGSRQWALSLNCHIVQKTPGWIAYDTKGEERQSDYIVQKANILTFTEVPLHCLPCRKVSFVPCDGFVQKRAHFATLSGIYACRLVYT